MQWSFTCFDVFDYGNPLCVECMWTDEDLQFGIQKLRLKHATIPVKNQENSAGISITLRVGQLRNCAFIPGNVTGFFLGGGGGTFAKLRQATISFVTSVCPSVELSVRTHATTRLPLDEFSRNLTFEYF